MHPLYSLQGQVALVTGCGSEAGIGFAPTTLLAGLRSLTVATACRKTMHHADAWVHGHGDLRMGD